MSQSITNYVSVSVSLEGTGPQPAGFGTPMLAFQHALESPRLAGPFLSVADVIAAGHAAGSVPVLWATAVFSQQPRVTSVFVGRIDAADATLAVSLSAILAANPGVWYALNIASRTSADILAAAAWVEAQRKIFIAQSNDASLLTGAGSSYQAVVGGTPTDGTYVLTFTGFGLVSPVTVTTTRTAGTPATSTLIGDALRAALVTAAAGSLLGRVDPASIGGTGATLTWTMLGTVEAGTIVASGTALPSATLLVTIPDQDIGSALFALQYTRTALVYHPSDTEYLDGAWTSRCLSFDLDQRKGIWAFKRLNGIAGTTLSNAQIAALRAVNVNYFAPAVSTAGVPISAFTAQGWVGSGAAGAGRRIDVTTTLDWAQARYEEALFSVLIRETHGVPYDDSGFNRFYAAAATVNATGLAAGHFVEFRVPLGEPQEGTQTPFITMPTLRSTSAAARVARTLTFSALLYLRAAIERVVFAVEVRQ